MDNITSSHHQEQQQVCKPLVQCDSHLHVMTGSYMAQSLLDNPAAAVDANIVLI